MSLIDTKASNGTIPSAAIHPLLQQNPSNLSEQRPSNKPSHIALSSLSEEQTFFTSTNKVQQTPEIPLVEPQEDHVLEVMEKLEKGTLSLDEAISRL